MTLNSNIKTEYQLGGEFSISVQDLTGPLITSKLDLPNKRNQLYLDTGRSAIYVALLSIIAEGGKREAWLPRYCCKSVLLPFLKLGFKINLYSLGSDLRSPSNLPAQLDGATFLFIHYFGKNNQVILDYLDTMKDHQVFYVIEDCVQALLNSNLGTHDYIIYSYRKFCPQPDGALLLSDYPLDKAKILPPNEAFVSQRLIGKLMRDTGDPGSFLDLFEQAEEMIDNLICPREMSWVSQYLLQRTDLSTISKKRRENFHNLIKLLRERVFFNELIHPLFDSLNYNEVPIGLPVIVKPLYRNKLRAFLISKQIYCPVHWDLEGEERVIGEEELLLSHSLLTLPIDQRIDSSALAYLVEKISDFFSQMTRELSDP